MDTPWGKRFEIYRREKTRPDRSATGAELSEHWQERLLQNPAQENLDAVRKVIVAEARLAHALEKLEAPPELSSATLADRQREREKKEMKVAGALGNLERRYERHGVTDSRGRAVKVAHAQQVLRARIKAAEQGRE